MTGVQLTIDQAIETSGMPAIDRRLAGDLAQALLHAGSGHEGWRRMTVDELSEFIATYLKAGFMGTVVSQQVYDSVLRLRDFGIIALVPGHWGENGSAWIPDVKPEGN